jgi:tRNA (cmo5U34)-methyltransferase
MVSKFTFATREEGFDVHIDNSIRGYNDLWNDVLKMSEYFVEDDTNVVDIGCSTGKMLASMIEQNKNFAPDAYYIGVELENDFVSAWDDHLRQYDNIQFDHMDIRQYKFDDCSFVSSIFTLLFMPLHDREMVMKNIYNGLNRGGAFVFAEKTRAESSRIHDIRTFTYYDFKSKSFSYDDIMTKEQTLRHMQKPDTRGDLLQMCRDAGFSQVDSFWQNHAFTGFIAIK